MREMVFIMLMYVAHAFGNARELSFFGNEVEKPS